MNPFAVEARIRDLADRAATDFLAPLSEKRASPDYIAKNAAKILAERGVGLSEMVTKVAREENLNPHEIARVCEEANKEVFGRLYKGAEDKTFEFAVADAREVMKALDVPYEGPGDIFLPVEHPKYAAEKTAAAPTPTSWASTALRPSKHQEGALSLEEEKQAQEAFRELAWEAKATKDQAALDFLKTARELVLEDERTLDGLLALVQEARPNSPAHTKVARELLAMVALDTRRPFAAGADLVTKYATVLAGESASQGDVPSDDLRTVDADTFEFWAKSPGARTEELVGPVSSGGDPVRVINGRHKLFTAIDTLIDQSGKESTYGGGLLVAGDRVRNVVRSVVNWTPKTENVEL